MTHTPDQPAYLQSCGYVVACNRAADIVSASKNILGALALSEDDVLGKPIAHVLPDVAPALDTGNERRLHLLTGRFPARFGKQNIPTWVRLVTPELPNPTGVWRLLEIKPEEGDVEQARVLAALANTALLCREAKDITALATGVTSAIKACFDCDRVSFCRLDHGDLAYVAAEECDEGMPPCLGLTFPPTTFSKIDHDRLLKNRVLFQADHAAPRIPFLGMPPSELDSRRLSLYSVSAEYSRVMLITGAQTTISIAVMLRGKLFGLVLCAFKTRCFPSVGLRHAAETFAHLLSSGVDQVWHREHDRHSNEGRVVRNALLSAAHEDLNFPGVLAERASALRNTLEACNVLYIAEQTVHQYPQDHAQVPSEQLGEIADLLRSKLSGGQDLYATTELLRELPELNVVRGVAGGVLAIRLPDSVIAVLRPEQIRSLRWVTDALEGDANEDLPSKEGRTKPRRRVSSSEHSIVRGTSDPWSEEDITFMEELRDGLLRLQVQRLQRAAQDMRSQIRGSEALETVLAQLSHELRNPMNPILGWSERLLSADAERDEIDLGLRAIRRNARVQARLIDNIFDASRIRLGSMEIDLEPVDIHSVIQTAIDVVERAASKKNIRFELDLDDNLGSLMLDRARMSQVFWNLLSNAVTYCPRESTIWLTAARVDTDLVVEVEDNGPGVDPQDLPSIFDRFQQAAAGRSPHQGLGLGLAIVKGVVELHGGRINAENTGKGLRFRIELPVIRAAATAAAEPAATGPLMGYRIMLVDDAEDSLELAAAVLRGQGAELSVFTSAPCALGSLDDSIDVLISDLGMPEMHGLDFIEQVRQRGYKMPAIALTAYRATKDRVASLRAGFQLHLGKPVSNEELVLSVLQLVGLRSTV